MGRSEEDNNGERKRKREEEAREEGEKKRKVLSSTHVTIVKEIEEKKDHSLPESVFLALLLPFVHSQVDEGGRRCGSCGGDILNNTDQLQTVLKERGRALKPVVASISSVLPSLPPSSSPCSCFSMPPPLDLSTIKFPTYSPPPSPLLPTPLSPISPVSPDSSPQPLLSDSSPPPSSCTSPLPLSPIPLRSQSPPLLSPSSSSSSPSPSSSSSSPSPSPSPSPSSSSSPSPSSPLSPSYPSPSSSSSPSPSSTSSPPLPPSPSPSSSPLPPSPSPPTPSPSSPSPSSPSPSLSPSSSSSSSSSCPPPSPSLSASPSTPSSPSIPSTPPPSSPSSPITLPPTPPSSPSVILEEKPISTEPRGPIFSKEPFPLPKKQQPQICADTFSEQNQDDSCVEVASPLVVVYPSSDHPYMVVIREADLSCLSARCYLNDNIILFYLLFIKHEKIPEWRAELRQSQPQTQGDELTFFFCDFFDESRATAKGAFEALERMTKPVTAQLAGGERDTSSLPHFLIFPIHCYKHWCLAIVSSSDGEEIRIDYLDSLGKHSDAVVKLLENFFQNCGWAPRPLNSKSSSSLRTTPRRVVIYDQEVPQQTNGFDCGLYILHYVELFCRHFVSGNKKWPFSKQWFPKSEVEEHKRGAIQYILTQKKYQKKPILNSSPPSSSSPPSPSSSPSFPLMSSSSSPPSPSPSSSFSSLSSSSTPPHSPPPPLFPPLSPKSFSQPLPGEERRGKGRRPIRSSSFETPVMIDDDISPRKRRPSRSSSLGDPIMIDDDTPSIISPSSSSQPPPSSSSSPRKKKKGGYRDVIGERGGRGEDVIVIGD